MTPDDIVCVSIVLYTEYKRITHLHLIFGRCFSVVDSSFSKTHSSTFENQCSFSSNLLLGNGSSSPKKSWIQMIDAFVPF